MINTVMKVRTYRLTYKDRTIEPPFLCLYNKMIFFPVNNAGLMNLNPSLVSHEVFYKKIWKQKVAFRTRIQEI